MLKFAGAQRPRQRANLPCADRRGRIALVRLWTARNLFAPLSDRLAPRLRTAHEVAEPPDRGFSLRPKRIDNGGLVPVGGDESRLVGRQVTELVGQRGRVRAL